MRQQYNEVFWEISKKWGLLCFAQSWKEQLLWAHYADGHKGIALGFEILKDEIIKVNYTSDEIRTQFELTNDSGEDEKRFLSLAKVKYKEWEYEKEYRILVKLEKHMLDNDLYYLDFGDRLKIKEIVLGSKFDIKSKKGIVSELANKLHVNVIATRPGWEDYKIHQDGTKTNLFLR